VHNQACAVNSLCCISQASLVLAGSGRLGMTYELQPTGRFRSNTT